MKHIIIFSNILNLFIGIAVLLNIYLLNKKYKQGFLNNLLYYHIFFNLLIFINLIYKYSLTNLFSYDFDNFNLILSIILITGVIISEYGITFKLISFITNLKSKAITRKVKYLFYTWGFIFGIVPFIIWGFNDFNLQDKFLFYLHAIWIFTMIVIILTGLISLLTYNNDIDYKKLRSIKAFGLIFLIAYILFTLNHVIFYFTKLEGMYIDAASLIIVNICPLIWLRFYYKDYNGNEILKDSGDILNKIVKEYNISTREKEVIELIMKGKSNKEIEDILFISFNTVKNHVYNIYQKLNVKSRSQLVYFVNNYS